MPHILGSSEAAAGTCAQHMDWGKKTAPVRPPAIHRLRTLANWVKLVPGHYCGKWSYACWRQRPAHRDSGLQEKYTAAWQAHDHVTSTWPRDKHIATRQAHSYIKTGSWSQSPPLQLSPKTNSNFNQIKHWAFTYSFPLGSPLPFKTFLIFNKQFMISQDSDITFSHIHPSSLTGYFRGCIS